MKVTVICNDQVIIELFVQQKNWTQYDVTMLLFSRGSGSEKSNRLLLQLFCIKMLFFPRIQRIFFNLKFDLVRNSNFDQKSHIYIFLNAGCQSNVPIYNRF